MTDVEKSTSVFIYNENKEKYKNVFLKDLCLGIVEENT